jgi:hypothetical protein
MIELYHHGSSVCAAKVRLVLAEKEIEWKGHYVDILKGDQFNPEYLKITPRPLFPLSFMTGTSFLSRLSSASTWTRSFLIRHSSLLAPYKELRCGFGPRRWTKICIQIAQK